MRRLITFGAGVLALAGAATWLALGASAATRAVAVQDDVFSDAVSMTSTTTITVGDTVLWTWSGSNPHTVSSTAAEPFDSGAPQTSGTFSHTFNALGTFTYVCVVHAPGMSGSVVVQAAAATATATNSPQPSSTTAPQATNTPVPQATNTTTSSTSTPAAATATAVPGASATPAAPGATVAAPTQAPAGAPASVVQIPRTGTGGAGSSDDGLLWLTAAAMVGIGGMVLVAVGRRQPPRY